MTDSWFSSGTTTRTQVLDDEFTFTFTALCRASGADDDQVQALVEEGLLQPSGSGPGDWQFSGLAVLRVRSTLRLARELELNLHAAAIVMDLLAEIESLKARR